MKILGIFLLICLPATQCVGSGGSPVVDCSPVSFVSEGGDLRCECRPDRFPSSCTTSWPGHSAGFVLEKKNVTRQDNGTQFTCLMKCGGQISTVVHTLQVAYGPSDNSVKISGPEMPFLTNGTQSLTLTCEATQVNPEPTYSWRHVLCENGLVSKTCIFTPTKYDDGRQVECRVTNTHTDIPTVASATLQLNLTYPPSSPPEVSGCTPGQPLQPDDCLRCTVTGGKPLVSSVIFSCENHTCPDEPDTKDSPTSVTSPLKVNLSDGITGTELKCRCSAQWGPEPSLYSLSTEVIFPSGKDPGSGEESNEKDGGLLAVYIAVPIVAVLVIGIVFVGRKRLERKKIQLKAGGGGAPEGYRPFRDEPDPFQPVVGDDGEDDVKASDLAFEADSGYSSPTDLQVKVQVVAPYDSSDVVPPPKPCRLVDSGNYTLVDEKSLGPKPMTSDGTDRHVDVHIHSSPSAAAKCSTDPYEVVDMLETAMTPSEATMTPSGATMAPRGAPPQINVQTKRQRFAPAPQHSRGPLGDYYTQVNKVPKEEKGLPTVQEDTDGHAGAPKESGAASLPDTKGNPQDGDAEDGTYDNLDRHRHHAPTPHQATEQLYDHIAA